MNHGDADDTDRETITVKGLKGGRFINFAWGAGDEIILFNSKHGDVSTHCLCLLTYWYKHVVTEKCKTNKELSRDHEVELFAAGVGEGEFHVLHSFFLFVPNIRPFVIVTDTQAQFIQELYVGFSKLQTWKEELQPREFRNQITTMSKNYRALLVSQSQDLMHAIETGSYLVR